MRVIPSFFFLRELELYRVLPQTLVPFAKGLLNTLSLTFCSRCSKRVDLTLTINCKKNKSKMLADSKGCPVERNNAMVTRSSSIQIQKKSNVSDQFASCIKSGQSYSGGSSSSSFCSSSFGSSFGRQIMVPLAFRTPPNGSPRDFETKSTGFGGARVQNADIVLRGCKKASRHLHNRPTMDDEFLSHSFATPSSPCSFSDKTFPNSLERESFFSQLSPTIHLGIDEVDIARSYQVECNGFLWNADVFESSVSHRSSEAEDPCQIDKIPVYEIL